MNGDLKDRVLRIRKLAEAIRDAALGLSCDEDRDIFLKDAAALDAQAAALELQARQDEVR